MSNTPSTIEIHDISDRPQFAWSAVACQIGACSCKAKREEKALWEEYRASNHPSREEAFATLKTVSVPANDQRTPIVSAWLNGELAEPANDDEEELIAAYLAA